MKFLPLALALLLAIGSHAAALQADAPSQLDHIRSAVGVYLTQVKQSAVKALDRLDDTEYSTYKIQMKESLDRLQAQLQVAQAAAAPYTNVFVSQLLEGTAAIRESIMSDVEALRSQLKTQCDTLREVVDRHIQEYRTLIDPVLEDYAAKHRSDMEALKARLEPLVEQLNAKITPNVEETKTALMPIVDAVRSKLTERLEGLKEVATPYVEEYKEQLTKALAEIKERAGALSTDELHPQLDALRERAAPVAEDARAKLQALYETIAAAISKS